MPRYLVLFIFFLILTKVDGQGQKFKAKYYLVESLDLENFSKSDRKILDSALTVYHMSRADTSKIEAIMYAVEGIIHDDWVKYNKVLERLCEECIGNRKKADVEKKVCLRYKATALNNFGYYYSDIQNDVFLSLQYYESAMELQNKLGYEAEAAMTLLNIGSVYQVQGKTDEAYEAFEKCLEVFERKNNQFGMMHVCNNMGSIRSIRGDLEQGLKFFEQGLKIAIELDKKSNQTRFYRNMGGVCLELKQLDKALEYLQMGRGQQKEVNDKRSLSATIQLMGQVYLEKKDTNLAITLLEEAQEVATGINDQSRIASINLDISEIFLNQNRPDKAAELAIESFYIAEDIEYGNLIKNCTDLLAKIYSVLKDDQLKGQIKRLVPEVDRE